MRSANDLSMDNDTMTISTHRKAFNFIRMTSIIVAAEILQSKLPSNEELHIYGDHHMMDER